MRKFVWVILFSLSLTIAPIKVSQASGISKSQQVSTRQRPIIVLAIAWSPSGEMLAVGRVDGLFLYDAEGKELNRLEAPRVGGIVWSPNSQLLAVSQNSSGQVLVLHAPNFEIEKEGIRTGGGRIPLSWSPDGTMLAVEVGREVVIWNTSDWQQIETITLPSDLDPEDHYIEVITVVQWSPNNELLAIGSEDGFVRIWDAASNQIIKSFDVQAKITDLDWFSDNNTLIIPSYREIYFWKINAEEITPLKVDVFFAFGAELNGAVIVVTIIDLDADLKILVLNKDGVILNTIPWIQEAIVMPFDITPDGESVTYPAENGNVITIPIFPG